MEKRGYMLHEFVAHSSDINCLSIGKKSNRVFITGSEDRKVNLWSIGNTTPLQTLQGHTSAVDSVAFDSGEVLVLGGAANGAIKLWDLEEAKIVRTLTGHRSSCTSVEFHPFGEFFASGSEDTDLKIWDIRKKGCIHTYTGHTRAIRNIKFTPDGRWVVTGGEDSIVKIWDLTAGKLLHEFKYHSGPIRCINFHPQEFLLATGSADRTVKFWDLETFEIIGSAGPEAGGVHAMTFHPDGRTLFCGLDSTLKVYSWEPIRCHDVVDIGWSNLADLSIYEGKLLGFSYQDSRVGVWLADISLIGPYALGVLPKASDLTEPIASFSHVKDELVRPPLLNQDLASKSKSSDKTITEEHFSRQGATSIHVPKLSPMSADRSKRDSRISRLSTPTQTRATRSSLATRGTKISSSPVPSKSGSSPVVLNTPTSLKRVPAMSESPPIKDIHAISTSLSAPRVAPRQNVDYERMKSVPIKDVVNESTLYSSAKSQKYPLLDNERESKPTEPTPCLISFSNIGSTTGNVTERLEKNLSLDKNDETPCSTAETGHVKFVRGVAIQLGKTKSLVQRWEKRDGGFTADLPCTDRPSSRETSLAVSEEKLTVDEDTLICNALVQSHDVFINSVKSRVTKLEVVRHFFEKNGIKGAIDAVTKLPDHAVQVDLVGALKEKKEVFDLELFSGLLPVLVGLLSSRTERHVMVSIEMMLELIKIFGTVIKSTLSATSPAKVDLQGEQRLKRCKSCFGHLQRTQPLLEPITRRGGDSARLAQELNLALQNLKP
ncbi:katanin p80 WD40 repeat-containing subunit B1 [Carex littledalei]|uniref:Katanin p80 WD40 repeat-containing subunit B1 homolog n=1 Tax=Carex littledalei TaxID=544730 RepID=A0A833VS55_9POAL|nr:katanin p80 WD40 repeat-containing subunit B1 [Carex littledalei]